MPLPPPPPRERISDAVQSLAQLLRERSSLSAEEACRILLKIPRAAPPVAIRLLATLIAGDRRFVLAPDGAVSLAPRSESRERALADHSFVVLDLETTGGSPVTDRILEIGIVRLEGGRPAGTFATLLNPGVPVPPFVTTMTGIGEATVAAAPTFPEVADQVADFVADSILIAHNLPFDRGFLNAELARHCGYVLANRGLCTVRLGRRLLPHLPDRRLDTLAEHYGLRFESRHRALDDARVTSKILLRFLEILSERGISSLDQVEALLSEGWAGVDPEEVSERERSRRPARSLSPPSGGSGPDR